ncbi:hypothetical protein [Amaricoccus sp.]|uniref:hypothetical protein n=1 Tax=Amaricoccus sp. TaxID=1872485 RepID=UPI001B6B39A9|nr:hypothetical protein [Amaricoccus sp.]MBP7241537.1 hypothetical protein [Amaricoccus sp.]
MNGSLGIGRLALGSVALLLKNFGFLFPLAFAPALLLTLATYALLGGPAPDAAAVTGSGGFLAGALALALNLVVGFLVTGVMCLAGLDAALGKRHRLGEYLAQTMRHAGPLVVLGTLLSLATAIGIALLVLPGLYIAARWLPWAPAMLFENRGWDAMGRAQELTEGLRWPLALAVATMGLVVVALLLAVSPLLVAADGSIAVATLLEAALTAVYYGLVACFTALGYLRLRELREGLDAAAVAASID